MSHIAREAQVEFPVNLTDDKIDHNAWYKRILYRHERGDKTLLSVQVQFANEALEGNQGNSK